MKTCVASSQQKQKPFVYRRVFVLERAMGVEPTLTDWKSVVLPIYDARVFYFVGVLGIEPKSRAPKARILPLYYTPDYFEF